LKAQFTKGNTVNLQLKEDEADWLKALVEKPIGDESKKDKKMRIKFLSSMIYHKCEE